MEKSCCCGEAKGKKTLRSQAEKKKLINRLSRIEGQIRGVKRMLEEDCYCVDILNQSAAANAAFSAFNRELLDRHIRSCVARDFREGREDSAAEELMEIISKLMK